MCDIVPYPCDDVPAAVASLTGRVLAEHPPTSVVMNDPPPTGSRLKPQRRTSRPKA